MRTAAVRALVNMGPLGGLRAECLVRTLRSSDSDLRAAVCAAFAAHGNLALLFRDTEIREEVLNDLLDWCRKNQATLRCERLAGLLDYLHEVDGASATSTTASDSAPTAAQGLSAEASASSSRGPPVSAVASVGEPGATSKGPPAQEYTGEYSVPVPKVGRPVLLPSSFSGSPAHCSKTTSTR